MLLIIQYMLLSLSVFTLNILGGGEWGVCRLGSPYLCSSTLTTRQTVYIQITSVEYYKMHNLKSYRVHNDSYILMSTLLYCVNSLCLQHEFPAGGAWFG